MTALILSVFLTSFTPVEKIVAVVGNSPILHSDVEDAMIQAGLDPTGDFLIDSETPEYHDALKNLVEDRLIVNAGVDAGFYPTEESIQNLVADELANYPMDTDVDIEYLSKVLADNQAAQTFIGRKVQASWRELPQSSEAYLSSNAELVEDIIMPRHIGWIYLPVIPSGPDFDSAMVEMTRLRNRIISGESFEELAREYSDDGSARNGGYLGTFGPGEMTYAFEDAAYSLEVGEISQPVATAYGIHIIKLNARNDDGTVEASHILRIVPVDEDDIDRTVAYADTILNSIRSSRLSFEDAAREYSRDRSSSINGGDMGMVPMKLWLPQIAETVEGLETGECSEPVVLTDAGGVVLIKLYEDSGEIEWDSYSDTELAGLVQQVIYLDTYNSVVDSLSNEIPVTYFVENMI